MCKSSKQKQACESNIATKIHEKSKIHTKRIIKCEIPENFTYTKSLYVQIFPSFLRIKNLP